jgi:alpha-beta hydrolase superfamily lysophospholipase
MLRLVHSLLVAVYVAVPVVAVAYALAARRRDDRGAAQRLASLSVTGIAAFAMAVSLCLIYGRALDAHVPLGQVLRATYFAAAMLLILRGFDYALQVGLRRLFRLHRPGQVTFGRAARVASAVLVRVALLLALGLPYVMAVVMTYRPKVVARDNPYSQLGFHYERVEFTTSDGVRLVGWWIPAEKPPRSDHWEDWGKQTVILCHGLAASKSNQLVLGRRLVPGGFNVLAFDFRAHGESGGQLTSYGAAEKRDVLAAIKWLRQNRPEQAQRICGVGASMGAAALISAAADPSPEGHAISAVAAYAAYDDLPAMVRAVAADYFQPPLGWLLEHVGLPIASAHVGADLSRYAPARDVRAVWPRPVLFIHGFKDQVIPFERGRALYEAADQPKYHVWFEEGTHNDIVTNEAAAAIVLEFFRTAHAVPVI